MVKIRPDEISSIIRKQIEEYSHDSKGLTIDNINDEKFINIGESYSIQQMLDNGIGFVNPFSQGDHPDGGYTSNIPKVLRAGIASGDIDWATYPEIEPTYRKIDRSIN